MRSIVLLILFVFVTACSSSAGNIIKTNPFMLSDELIMKYDNQKYNKLIKLKVKLESPDGIQEKIYDVPNNLKILNIGGHPLSFHSLEGFKQLQDVEILYLLTIYNSNKDLIVQTIKNFTNLKKLYIIQCFFEDISFINNFKELETLVIYGMESLNEINLDFQFNTHLKYFAITNFNLYLESTKPKVYIDRKNVYLKKLPNTLQLASFIGSEAIKMDIDFIKQLPKSTEIQIDEYLYNNISLKYVKEDEKDGFTLSHFKKYANVRILDEEESKYFKPFKKQEYNIFKDKEYYLQITN